MKRFQCVSTTPTNSDGRRSKMTRDLTVCSPIKSNAVVQRGGRDEAERIQGASSHSQQIKHVAVLPRALPKTLRKRKLRKTRGLSNLAEHGRQCDK